MADLVGERYEPLEVIERVEAGEVVRALDHLSGRQVVLDARHLLSELEHQSLRATARNLLEAPAHPGLAGIREEFSVEDSHYLVCDWVAGRPLGRILRDEGRPGLPFGQVVNWLVEAAAALDHLHQLRGPAVHGRVSPDHLILTPDGRVVLAGLGHTSLGGPGGPWGPDPASDIDGLAVTAHILLSGFTPGAGGGSGIAGLSDADAEGVRHTLDRALAGDATGRPATASALVTAIRAAADTLMAPPEEPQVAAPMARAEPPSVPAEAPVPATPAARSHSDRMSRSNRLRGWAAAALAGLLAVTLLQVRAAQADREQSRRLQLASMARALTAQVDGELAAGNHERAALIARQAHLFDRGTGGTHESEVRRALRSALTASNPSRTLGGFHGPVLSVAISPDGQAVAGAGSAVHLFDLGQPGGPLVTLTGHPGAVSSLAFSPTSETLATGGEDPGVRLWDLSRTGAPPTVLGGHTAAVTSLAFAPAGERLATAGRDGTVRLWDLAAEPPGAVVLSGHTGVVTAVAFSPDGNRLASAGDDGRIQVWDVTEMPAAAATLASGTAVPAVAFSPDGGRLAAAADAAVLVWDLAEPDGVPRTLTGHAGPVRAVASRPGGTTLASGGEDGTIRLWPWEGNGTATVLPGHRGPVSSLGFSRDGRTLASGSADGTARLWRLGVPDTHRALQSGTVTTAGLADLVCDQVGRNLTRGEWAAFVGPGVGYRPTCAGLPGGD